MHKTIFGRMGRTGQTLRSRSSSQHGHNHASSRLHPYTQAKTTLETATAVNRPSSTIRCVPKSPVLINTRIPETSGSEQACTRPEAITRTPAAESTAVASACSGYMDDAWSPFDLPSVQQCIAGRALSLPSLLEHKEHTPMYMPSQNMAVAAPGMQSSSPFANTYAAPATRNSSLFTTTYAGHAFANEQITVRIMDVESGEYLQRFPILRRDA